MHTYSRNSKKDLDEKNAFEAISKIRVLIKAMPVEIRGRKLFKNL